MTSALPVRILVRTDIDWQQMTPAQMAAQADQDRPLLFIKYAVNSGLFDLWDRTFALDFFTFRHELAGIAQRNLAAVDGATVTRGLADFGTWLNEPGDEWVVPVDDDDYFDPGLAQVMRSAPADSNVVLWPELNYYWAGTEAGTPGNPARRRGQPLVATARQLVLWTNNWAIRRSYLRDAFTPADARRVLTDHSFASVRIGELTGVLPPVPEPWFDFSLTGAGIHPVPTSHSLTVKHPGSLFFLWVILQKDDPAAELAMRSFGEPVDIPAAAQWAEPEIREVERLLRSMRRPGRS